MFKGIQQALDGDIRSMGFVLTEYKKAIESEGSVAHMPTTEEDLKTLDLCAKRSGARSNTMCARSPRKQLDREIRAEIALEQKRHDHRN